MILLPRIGVVACRLFPLRRLFLARSNVIIIPPRFPRERRLLTPAAVLGPTPPRPLGHALQRRHRPARQVVVVVVTTDQPGLGVPARVGLGGEEADALLAAQVVALLLEGGRGVAQVAEPLVPLGRRDDVAVVRGARVLDDAAPAPGAVVAADVAELPVGVALEVKTCWEGLAGWVGEKIIGEGRGE